MKLPFKKDYPMTVQEFRDLAELCQWPEAGTWKVSAKKIAEVLEMINESFKIRLLKAKDTPRANWGDIEDLPKADKKGESMTSSIGRIEGIKRAFYDLAWNLMPKVNGVPFYRRDFAVQCPVCKNVIEVEVTMRRPK